MIANGHVMCHLSRWVTLGSDENLISFGGLRSAVLRRVYRTLVALQLVGVHVVTWSLKNVHYLSPGIISLH